MKPLRNLIKKVDYFSENINLEFGGQQKFETALGGLAATQTGQQISKRVLIHDIEMLPDEEEEN